MRTLLCVLMIMAVSPSPGAQRCACIANGQRIERGQIACIRPESGAAFLARCDTVLNNTSWTKLQDGCPSARADPPPASPSPAAADP